MPYDTLAAFLTNASPGDTRHAATADTHATYHLTRREGQDDRGSCTVYADTITTVRDTQAHCYRNVVILAQRYTVTPSRRGLTPNVTYHYDARFLHAPTIPIAHPDPGELAAAHAAALKICDEHTGDRAAVLG